MALSSVSDRYQDPGRTLMVQQVEAWFQLKKRWTGKEDLLERTWGLTVQKLEEASSRWQMVKGPLAATVAYLLDLGWQPRDSDEWLDTRGARHTMHTPQQECRVLDLLQQTYQEEMDRRIATGIAAPELKGGVDWTVGRKLLGGFKKEGRTTKASALRCVCKEPWCVAKTLPSRCAPGATRKQTGSMCSWIVPGGKPRTGSYRASYEVQGKTRFLTMLARGGSRVCYTLDREPRWVLKVGIQEATSSGSFLRCPWIPGRRSAGGSPSRSRFLGSRPRT